MLGVPTVMGFRTGLLHQLATLAGTIVGTVLAGRLQGPVSRITGSVIEGEGTARVAGFVLVFIATLVAAWLLAALLQRVLSFLLLGWVDKVGGALLGLVMGALLVAVVLLVMDRLPVTGARAALEASSLAGTFQRYVLPLVKWMPGELGSVGA